MSELLTRPSMQTRRYVRKRAREGSKRDSRSLSTSSAKKSCATKPATTCPYRAAADRHAGAVADIGVARSVLENLDLLEKAGREMDEARKLAVSPGARHGGAEKTRCSWRASMRSNGWLLRLARQPTLRSFASSDFRWPTYCYG